MSPTQLRFNNHHASSTSSPFKINKDSHAIKKASPPSSSSSSSTSTSTSSLVIGGPTTTRQQRHPVIIYTRSPKIIHTHPKDFMALVQKLTGLSRSEEDDQNVAPTPKTEPENYESKHENDKFDSKSAISDDNKSSSVVTDENNGSTLGDGQINSCYAPPMFDLQNCGFGNSVPFFNPNSVDILGSAQPFYNYPESLYLMPNMRSSFSSSTLEGMKELPDL